MELRNRFSCNWRYLYIINGNTKARWGHLYLMDSSFENYLQLMEVSQESRTEFLGKAVEVFTASFFSNQISEQNIGIIF